MSYLLLAIVVAVGTAVVMAFLIGARSPDNDDDVLIDFMQFHQLGVFSSEKTNSAWGVVNHDKQVLGVGKTAREAIRAAMKKVSANG